MKRCIILICMIFPLVSSAALDTKKIEKIVFTLTNKERKKRNLPSYKYNRDLHWIARIHSKNMVKHDFFSHTDQLGRGPTERKVKYVPGLFGGIGENIAYHYGNTEEEVAANLLKSWMNSKGHRANILSGSYSHLGVGIYKKGQYYYATQNFGSLQAKLISGLEEPVKYGETRVLTFTYLGTIDPGRLTIFIMFPDKRAKYYTENNRYYTGLGPFTPQWIDEKTFTLTITFEYGAGDYEIVMGFDGNYFPDGLIIPAGR